VCVLVAVGWILVVSLQFSSWESLRVPTWGIHAQRVSPLSEASFNSSSSLTHSLPSSIDFTSLKRFHRSLAPKCYSHTARYFLFSCMCSVFTVCFVFHIHVYFKVSVHVFHACQCKWPIGPFV